MMSVAATENSVKMGHLALSSSTSKQDLIALLGAPSRLHVTTCYIAARGTTSGYIYDDLGIIFCYEEPEDEVSHLRLAISPADTPLKPKKAFAGTLNFHGTVLNCDTREKAFLRNPGAPVSGHYGSYSYKCDEYSFWLRFGKMRNRIGKKAGPAVLLYVEIVLRKPVEA